MHIKYYIIPENDKLSECLDSLTINQNINTKDIIILCDNDISQIFRVPYIQKYQDFALVISSQIKINKYIDIDNLIFDNDCIVKDTDNTFFIINCSNEIIKNKFSAKNIVKNDLRQYLSQNEFSKLYRLNDKLNHYYDKFLLNKNINFLNESFFKNNIGD